MNDIDMEFAPNEESDESQELIIVEEDPPQTQPEEPPTMLKKRARPGPKPKTASVKAPKGTGQR